MTERVADVLDRLARHLARDRWSLKVNVPELGGTVESLVDRADVVQFRFGECVQARRGGNGGVFQVGAEPPEEPEHAATAARARRGATLPQGETLLTLGRTRQRTTLLASQLGETLLPLRAGHHAYPNMSTGLPRSTPMWRWAAPFCDTP